jgi:hypothetical protein
MRYNKYKTSFFIYIVTIIALFLYSFTQIDLGLALTRFPGLFAIQRAFQSVGYFNRPLSTYLFITIISLLFCCYTSILNNIRSKKMEKKTVWRLILVTAGVLLFSYNAFSYDLFNYIFDAKIVTHYHQNPYDHKALDYAGDPMLGFMHWTHRTYPYGPVWLGLTIPLSFIGFQYFLLTFLLFKVLAAASYVGTAYFIGKIMKKVKPHDELFSVVVFALNPLVIIESLISAHLDIVMMFLAVYAIYALIEKKYILACIVFLLSIGLKFATVFFFPVFAVLLTLQIMKNKIPWRPTLSVGVFSMLLSVLAASQTSGNFQPWYLLTVIPFVALLGDTYYVYFPLIIIPLFITMSYVPFLYAGNWDPPIPSQLTTLYVLATISTIFVLIYYRVREKKQQ